MMIFFSPALYNTVATNYIGSMENSNTQIKVRTLLPTDELNTWAKIVTVSCEILSMR